jgi:hypothetical protein
MALIKKPRTNVFLNTENQKDIRRLTNHPLSWEEVSPRDVTKAVNDVSKRLAPKDNGGD